MTEATKTLYSVRTGTGTAVHLGNESGTVCGAGTKHGMATVYRVDTEVTCSRCQKVTRRDT